MIDTNTINSDTILQDDNDLKFVVNQYTVTINKDIIIKKVLANNIADAYTQALLKISELSELPWSQINYTTEQTKITLENEK